MACVDVDFYFDGDGDHHERRHHMTAKNLDNTGRKPPAQPKVKTLTPRPAQPPWRPVKLAIRDPRAKRR